MNDGQGHRNERTVDAVLIELLERLRNEIPALRVEVSRSRDILEGLREWSNTYGAALNPAGRSDTFGEGMRAAKHQVSARLSLDSANTTEYIRRSDLASAIQEEREVIADMIELIADGVRADDDRIAKRDAEALSMALMTAAKMVRSRSGVSRKTTSPIPRPTE